MRVLFVEDDPMNRQVVRDMLGVAGAVMDEAEDAVTGLAMVDATAYDIVLMDLRMPGMDGHAAIRHIRARGDTRAAVPIIVVTADMAPDLHERCLADGADEVIQKPVSMTALFDAIARLMTRHASGDLVLV